MNTTLILSLDKIDSYTKEDIEYMLPSIILLYSLQDSEQFEDIIQETILNYTLDIGEVAAMKQYYENMYRIVCRTLQYAIDPKLLANILETNEIIEVNITHNDDVFIKLTVKG